MIVSAKSVTHFCTKDISDIFLKHGVKLSSIVHAVTVDGGHT